MKKLILFLSFLTFSYGTGFNGINLGDSVQEVAFKLDKRNEVLYYGTYTNNADVYRLNDYPNEFSNRINSKDRL